MSKNDLLFWMGFWREVVWMAVIPIFYVLMFMSLWLPDVIHKITKGKLGGPSMSSWLLLVAFWLTWMWVSHGLQLVDTYLTSISGGNELPGWTQGGIGHRSKRVPEYARGQGWAQTFMALTTLALFLASVAIWHKFIRSDSTEPQNDSPPPHSNS